MGSYNLILHFMHRNAKESVLCSRTRISSSFLVKVNKHKILKQVQNDGMLCSWELLDAVTECDVFGKPGCWNTSMTDWDVFEITSSIIPVITSQSSLSLSSRTCFGIRAFEGRGRGLGVGKTRVKPYRRWMVLRSQKRTVASSKMQVVRRRRRPFS